MKKHIFEQAADILDVPLDASPTLIRAAYRSTAKIANKPGHILRMAYDLLTTSTATARTHTVRLHHRSARLRAALNLLESVDTPVAITRKERMEAYGRTGSLEGSIAYLHLAYGHY
ncbi:MAG: hypothetical protein ACYDD9_02185 [Acidithiobacillus sp.]|uniref:Uncharacterized protein n=1 Tax=Acidithiobacillus thiooxidans TaxID=930 RepID=A0A1C2IIK0_ACITH|nr:MULTISPECIES: hypothetical protein [Acidithiobacillus]MBU2772658.1 hypothetical protein [Acidithiobacillus ferrooxidans]OCX68244.1 hypothetical protein A6P07_18645 [Acidithiobacillus thiooxidans]OCX75824.1 hypothetical protein A6O24_09600 [Acidithiobacillus thiooxidans]OCX79537.1 hypothetical protein A6O26_16440 [Acidithiobacillus thiooxidans]OCX86306.1 hypothetical protein A6M27_13050 [Acidithiobacillus thiooxidans]